MRGGKMESQAPQKMIVASFWGFIRVKRLRISQTATKDSRKKKKLCRYSRMASSTGNGKGIVICSIKDLSPIIAQNPTVQVTMFIWLSRSLSTAVFSFSEMFFIRPKLINLILF